MRSPHVSRILPAAAALAGVAALAVAAPSSAQAATVKCKIGYYAPGADEGTPTPAGLRAVGLPKKTDGYAPPCLVAEAAVQQIQLAFGDDGKLPTRLTIFGARWSAGKWNCTYATAEGSTQAATCRKAGKPSRKIKVTLAT